MTNTEWKSKAAAIIAVLLLSMCALVIVPDSALASTTPTWTTASSLLQNRTESAYAQVGDILYIMGGGNLTSGADNLVFSYNMITGESRSLANMPIAERGAAAAATGDGRIFVFGGLPASDATQIYNISTNTWTTGPNMPVGAWQAKAAFDPDSNSILVAGGEGISSHMTDLQILDSNTLTWSAGTPLPIGVKTGNLVYSNGYLLYFGGENTTGVTNAMLSSYGGTWQVVKPMPARLTYAAATRGIDGQIYIIGGSDQYYLGTNALKGVYAYEPSSNTWTVAASLPEARENPVAGATSEGRIFCEGGTNLTESMKSVISLRIASVTIMVGPTTTGRTGQQMTATVTMALAYRSLDHFHSEVFLMDSEGTDYDIGTMSSIGGQATMGFTVPQFAGIGSAQVEIPSLHVHDANDFSSMSSSPYWPT